MMWPYDENNIIPTEYYCNTSRNKEKFYNIDYDLFDYKFNFLGNIMESQPKLYNKGEYWNTKFKLTTWSNCTENKSLVTGNLPLCPLRNKKIPILKSNNCISNWTCSVTNQICKNPSNGNTYFVKINILVYI